MTVKIQYIVERNGVEKEVFTDKKAADAYDKMLDIADELSLFVKKCDIELTDDQIEAISLYQAENRDELGQILKGVKPKVSKPKVKSANGKTSDNKFESESADEMIIVETPAEDSDGTRIESESQELEAVAS